jgi:hypothetical protein
LRQYNAIKYETDEPTNWKEKGVVIFKIMLQIINVATVRTFRKFTLTSGYNSENTKFVRVSDGYSVGADPIQVKNKEYNPNHPDWASPTRFHHVSGCGYLYACRKGYVLATQKGGYQGWSDVVEMGEEYKCFNPFINKVISLKIVDGVLNIDDNKAKSPIVIGTFSTVFGEMPVMATPFKGLKGFMRLLRVLPEWATIHVNNISYNETLTRKYDMGLVTEGQFDVLESFNLHTVEYCNIEKSNYIVKANGRVFLTNCVNSKYSEEDQLLSSKGILTLEQGFNSFTGAIQISCNVNSETTESMWLHHTCIKPVITNKVKLSDKPFAKRELLELEIELIDKVEYSYSNFQCLSISLGLNDNSNSMYDELRSLDSDSHENVKAVYYALEKTAAIGSKNKCARMLSSLMHMPFEMNCNDNHYEFEKARLLGTFLNACIKHERDIIALWTRAFTVDPEYMGDWLNNHLAYSIVTSSVGNGKGGHYRRGVEVRSYKGVITYALDFGGYSNKYLTTTNVEVYNAMVNAIQTGDDSDVMSYRYASDAYETDAHEGVMYDFVCKKGLVNSRWVDMEVELLPIPQHQDYNICNQYGYILNKLCTGTVVSKKSNSTYSEKPTYYRVVSIDNVMQPSLQLKEDVTSVSQDLVPVAIILNFLGINYEGKSEEYWFMRPKGGFDGVTNTRQWLNINQ